jgi:hypothetical protein
VIDGNKKKLRTYGMFKQTIEYSQYLSHVKNRNHKRSLVCLRLSCHPLKIETGRYSNVAEVNRLCPVCLLSVETEMHFLLECSGYTNLRETLWTQYAKEHVGFDNLNDVQQFMLIIDPTPQTAGASAKFVYNALQARKSKITP